MAIRIPPPKTPTDGTLLTSARKVADEWYQPPLPKQGPQWRLWANLPEVQLWEAVALSCDIEPKYYLGDADPEFQLRMRIAIGNGLGKGDRPHCALVTLTDVTRLARRCGWTLPPEFPGTNPLEHALDPTPPNWGRWLHVPSIELGNAIALSLDIDPKCLSSGRHLIPNTFVTRLQVAIEHLQEGGVLAKHAASATQKSIRVSWLDVAVLAQRCDWSVPVGFPDALRLSLGDLATAEDLAASEKVVTSRTSHDAGPIASEPLQERRWRPVAGSDIGVTKDEILAVFPNPIQGQTEEQWANMLADGRAKWLKPARVDRGGRGVQSRWNPAELAMCLARKRHMGRGALGSLIRRCFPEYLPEWEAYADSFD